MKLEHIIVLQNKIDIVMKDKNGLAAQKQYEEIKKSLSSGTG